MRVKGEGIVYAQTAMTTATTTLPTTCDSERDLKRGASNIGGPLARPHTRAQTRPQTLHNSQLRPRVRKQLASRLTAPTTQHNHKPLCLSRREKTHGPDALGPTRSPLDLVHPPWSPGHKAGFPNPSPLGWKRFRRIRDRATTNLDDLTNDVGQGTARVRGVELS